MNDATDTKPAAETLTARARMLLANEERLHGAFRAGLNGALRNAEAVDSDDLPAYWVRRNGLRSLQRLLEQHDVDTHIDAQDRQREKGE